MLYESPGGNQVDGLPPVPTLTGRQGLPEESLSRKMSNRKIKTERQDMKCPGSKYEVGCISMTLKVNVEMMCNTEMMRTRRKMI